MANHLIENVQILFWVGFPMYLASKVWKLQALEVCGGLFLIIGITAVMLS